MRTWQLQTEGWKVEAEWGRQMPRGCEGGLRRCPASPGEPQKACYWGDTDRCVLKVLTRGLEAEGTEDKGREPREAGSGVGGNAAVVLR